MALHRATPPLPYSHPYTRGRNIGVGGPPFRGSYAVTNHSVTSGGRENNTLFYKTRGPFFVIGNSYPIADTVRQSEQGPERPRMRLATGAYRRWVGGDPQWKGYHTYLDEQNAAAKSQGTAKGGMRGTRLNRLTFQQYRGQSYSQSTTVMG
jgi:hypothetical protein